jgi:choline kinase
MNPALCIVAAGCGQRMNGLTKNVNKAMLPLNGEAVVTKIINTFPSDCDIVVALGYQGESLKEYLLAAHDDRNFIFVNVDRYDGPGSGPGHSLMACKDHLQRPFYFSTVDSLILSKMPPLESNWVGCARTDQVADYTGFNLEGNYVAQFCRKGEDKQYVYVGVCGVKDYSCFWQDFERYNSRTDDEYEHVGVFYDCFRTILWRGELMDWVDTGSEEKYVSAVKKLSLGDKEYELKKNTGEITYFVNNKVIKLTKNALQRAKRGEALGHTPRMLFKGNHLYAYEYVDGEILYELNDFNTNKQFIHWCNDNWWQNKIKAELDYKNFYFTKTLSRVEQFLSHSNVDYCNQCFVQMGAMSRMVGQMSQRIKNKFNNIIHKKLYSCNINGVEYPSIYQLLNRLPESLFLDGIPILFHGDLNLGNCLLGGDGKFYLIDWRDGFGDTDSLYGDLYYDLGKLYAGLDVSWMLMSQHKFSVSIRDRKIEYDYASTNDLVKSREYFEGWVKERYDLTKVKIIAALVSLNMSPLHSEEIGNFLFFHGYKQLACTILLSNNSCSSPLAIR